MAIAVASIGTVTTTDTGTDVALAAPSGVQIGDLLIAHLQTENTITSVPSGFNTGPATSIAGNLFGALWYKIADSGDAAASTFTFTSVGSGAKGGSMWRITGFNSSSPINTSDTSNDTSATITCGSVTPSVADCLFILFVGMRSDGAARTVSGYNMAIDNPAMWSEGYDAQWNSNARQISAAYALRPQTSNTGACTATGTGSDPNTGIVIAIAPGTGPTGIKTWNGIPIANIKTINGVAIGSVKGINGIT
jgi:hypothetical protein